MSRNPENESGLEFRPSQETEIQSVSRLWRALNSSVVYENFRQVADSLRDVGLGSLRAPKILCSNGDRLVKDLKETLLRLEKNDPLRVLEGGLVLEYSPYEKRSPMIVQELRYNKDEKASGGIVYVGETLYITITEKDGEEVIEIGHMEDSGEASWDNVSESTVSEWTNEESLEAMRYIFKDNPVRLPFDTYIPPLLRDTS